MSEDRSKLNALIFAHLFIIKKIKNQCNQRNQENPVLDKILCWTKSALFLFLAVAQQNAGKIPFHRFFGRTYDAAFFFTIFKYNNGR